MEERERSPLPRDAFSFAFFLSSLLSLSLFPKTRATQSQRRRPFVCGLLSAFSFFFSKIRESSLTLSRAVARVFKFFHQRSSSEKKKRRRRDTKKKEKKRKKKGESTARKDTSLSLSLLVVSRRPKNSDRRIGGARVSLPSSSSSSSSSPFPPLSR